MYRDETPDELVRELGELARTDFLGLVFGIETGGQSAPYLLYKDPDSGFTIRAVTIKPRFRAPIHDHGYLWALYAVCRGATEMEVFARTDDESEPGTARLEVARRFRISQGESASFPTYAIHRPTNLGDDWLVIVNVYSGDLAEVDRHRYDPDTHKAIAYRGSGAGDAAAEIDLSHLGAAAARIG
jgi:predicted metal-dependent enzyme (double-stranded beta helix superfamily)